MYFIILVHVDCSADTFIFDDGYDTQSACNDHCMRFLYINRYYFSTKTWKIIGEYDGISVAVVVIVVVLELLVGI